MVFMLMLRVLVKSRQRCAGLGVRVPGVAAAHTVLAHRGRVLVPHCLLPGRPGARPCHVRHVPHHLVSFNRAYGSAMRTLAVDVLAWNRCSVLVKFLMLVLPCLRHIFSGVDAVVCI